MNNKTGVNKNTRLLIESIFPILKLYGGAVAVAPVVYDAEYLDIVPAAEDEYQRNRDTEYCVGFAFHYYILLGMLTMVQKVQVNIQVTPVVFSSLKLEFQRRNKLI